jgi:hypothetical protein
MSHGAWLTRVRVTGHVVGRVAGRVAGRMARVTGRDCDGKHAHECCSLGWFLTTNPLFSNVFVKFLLFDW